MRILVLLDGKYGQTHLSDSGVYFSRRENQRVILDLFIVDFSLRARIVNGEFVKLI